jgi:hypothetical protein
MSVTERMPFLTNHALAVRLYERAKALSFSNDRQTLEEAFVDAAMAGLCSGSV